jgi:hypothetical protein
MKTFNDVQKTRIKYHKEPDLNPIHRSSLMVPEIQGSIAEISFLNHFLLKRNYDHIACVITPIGIDGKKLDSRLHVIDEPRVYRFTLTGISEQLVSNYMVEFFSSKNLFIPFSAVMVNHRSDDFFNQVHSFNRSLNDIFEDDEVNNHVVKEASVDLILNDNIDTCLLFTAGPMGCSDTVDIEIVGENETFESKKQINLPRFGTELISISNTFKNIPNNFSGILKASQPKQPLFYGRLLGGQWNSSGEFSANHTYYDFQNVEDYWKDNQPSKSYYPFFSELINSIRIYPLSSPSELEIFVTPVLEDSTILDEIFIDNLISPSNKFIDKNLNSLFSNLKIDLDKLSSYIVTAKVKNGKKPGRISLQVVYGKGSLESSINMTLYNPGTFVGNKKSFKWGQTVTSSKFETLVGITTAPIDDPTKKIYECHVQFYDETGKIADRNWEIKSGTSKKFTISEELNLTINQNSVPHYVWCVIEGDPGISFNAVTYNNKTNNCSGDHGF